MCSKFLTTEQDMVFKEEPLEKQKSVLDKPSM